MSGALQCGHDMGFSVYGSLIARLAIARYLNRSSTGRASGVRVGFEVWRTQGERCIMPPMVRREQSSERDILTQAELEELRYNLSHLSGPSVENFYREAHAECAVERKPSPKAIQRLVTAWKILRRWNWR